MKKHGMPKLNFRDERYLPFEGAGAISTWQLELIQANEYIPNRNECSPV